MPGLLLSQQVIRLQAIANYRRGLCYRRAHVLAASSTCLVWAGRSANSHSAPLILPRPPLHPGRSFTAFFFRPGTTAHHRDDYRRSILRAMLRSKVACPPCSRQHDCIAIAANGWGTARLPACLGGERPGWREERHPARALKTCWESRAPPSQQVYIWPVVDVVCVEGLYRLAASFLFSFHRFVRSLLSPSWVALSNSCRLLRRCSRRRCNLLLSRRPPECLVLTLLSLLKTMYVLVMPCSVMIASVLTKC